MTDVNYLTRLVEELCKTPKETEWVEFKLNNADPEEIGEKISALANSAALCGKAHAYLIWGIDDNNHHIHGTSFSVAKFKMGNEEGENWLLRLLSPRIHFEFIELKINEKSIVLLKIQSASYHPVQFKGVEFIRVGSYTKKLKDYPEKERKLWQFFDQTSFESQVAAENLSGQEVLQLLDYPSYFSLLKLPLPETSANILDALEADTMISRGADGHWSILNQGAILFAKTLENFKTLKRKAVRVVFYKDNSRIETIREKEGTKGYACGFEGLIGYINDHLPSNEIIEQALRKNVPMYPELAIRELIANALIHQDFFISGTGPMIEIFIDRIEITNPGKPLIETSRLLDSPPRSRNEALAAFMRRIGVCEERGSGVDKVVSQTEFYQLPAPLFETIGDNTRVILFAHKSINKMDKDDRIRACYLHACLKHVTRENMTNTSLRERFGIEAKNSAIASRIIKETIAAGLIRLYDPETSRKFAKYVPFWA
ncbi:MAG: ATPase, 4 family [Gammaproteobacteria bacterium]|jgi:predicted HTH transcriptional regulator|nr:ATPase, 4 family [Gammaproteobacteria bacterium]